MFKFTDQDKYFFLFASVPIFILSINSIKKSTTSNCALLLSCSLLLARSSGLTLRYYSQHNLNTLIAFAD